MKKTSSSDKVSQDDIIKNTKNVLRGLETLKNEHNGLLSTISSKLDNKENEFLLENGDDKAALIQSSLEKINLGIGEAQVGVCDRSATGLITDTLVKFL